MIEKISAPITVATVYNHKVRKFMPTYVLWEGRSHKIEKIGLHHSYRDGRSLMHVFSVASETLFMRLVFNTENLTWRLEQISDGNPD